MKAEDKPVTADMIFFWPEERWKKLVARIYSTKGAARVKKHRIGKRKKEKV